MIRTIDIGKDILVLRGRCTRCFTDVECDDEDAPETGHDTGYPWRNSIPCPKCDNPVRMGELRFPLRSQ